MDHLTNHISPVNHSESPITGSTIDTMVSKTKEMGLGYFAVTDHGYLTAILKAYQICQKKGIKLIPGVELYFKDNNCKIIRNTESQQIKYFKIVVHAKDQASYQVLVKKCSNFDKNVVINDSSYPLFDWADLEELSKHSFTVCTSDTQCMVSKHLLVGRPDLGMKYYEKLRDLFDSSNFYPSILPFEHDRYWNSLVKIELPGHTVHIPINDRVGIEGEKRSKAFEVYRKKQFGKPCHLTHVSINKVLYGVKESLSEVLSAKLVNDFVDIPEGDIQLKANKFILALAKRYGDLDRLLINNYSYYADRDDKVVQDMRLGEERRVIKSQFMRRTSDVREYLTTKIGLEDSFITKMVKNSHDWADKFKDFNLKYEYRLPDVGENPKKQMMDAIAAQGRLDWNNPIYVKQFNEEMDLLENNGVKNLIPYFIPLIDIFKFYEDNGYLVGPGRGSVGGFLIAYLMGITQIDPIKYKLSSARFATIDRIRQGSWMDIDSDFEDRGPLVGKDGNGGYLKEKYGNKVAQCSTRTLLRIKSAILDANRFVNNGTLEQEIQALSKTLPDTPPGITDYDSVFGYENSDGEHIRGLLEINKDLRNYTETRPKEWEIVKKSLSLSRQMSRHASAYIISDVDIEETVPVFEVGGVKRITQPDAKDCEYAGLVKLDLLVVLCLKDIRMCMESVNKRNGIKLKTGYFIHEGKETYIYDLPEDQKVFKMLSDGKTETVFQLNTSTVTPFLMRIKPTSIVDCAVTTSLVRPGPLGFIDEITGNNMVQEYIERKNGHSKTDIPILNSLIPETYSVLCFQEQVSKIATELGKMSVADSEDVRVAMGKKKFKLLDSLKPKFIEGSCQTVDAQTAEKIWQMMIKFASYGFNASHATAYATVSYACAFLKYHYPLEWWAAVLSNSTDKEIKESHYKHVKDLVLPPDINVSTEEISIDYNLGKLRSKLSMISGVGGKAAEKIVSGRPYVDIKDFVSKKVAGPGLTCKLIHVGVLNSLFPADSTLLQKLQIYEDFVEIVKYEEKVKDAIYNLSIETDRAKYVKSEKAIQKLKDKGPSKGNVDSEYVMLTPKKDFLMKKAVFPTMNLDLHKVMLEDSELKLLPGKPFCRVMNKWARELPLVTGEHLQRIDLMEPEEEIYAACAGYVIDCKEFEYSNGSKKALKIIIDSSGYVSEKVLWPDYDSGELRYPKSLKKGSIAYFFYKRKKNGKGQCYTNITEIHVEC